MALITNNISGSESGNSRIGITGSVVIGDAPQSAFPSLGSDTVFFVSGSETSKSVFGGATKISGSLSTDGNVVLGNSNDDIITISGSAKFSQGLSGSLTKLSDGTSYLIAGTNVTITTGSNGAITIDSTGGGSGAPTGAQYVTLATNASLTDERVLTAGTGISLTDAGAGSTVTLAVRDSVVATVSGTQFTGTVGVTGSLGASTLNILSGVLYHANGTIRQDSNLVWDADNDRLGIGTTTPGRPLHIAAAGGWKVSNSTNTTGLELINASSTMWRFNPTGTTTDIELYANVNIPTNGAAGLGFTPSAGLTKDTAIYRSAAGLLNISGSAPGTILRFNAASTPLAAGDLGMNTGNGRPNAYIGGAVKELAHNGEIAPVTSSYVVMALDPMLSADRVLTAGTGLTLTDGGAGSNATLAINNSIVATVSGTTFTGAISAAGVTSTAGLTQSGGNVSLTATSSLILSGAAAATYTLGGETGTGTITIGRSTASNTINIGSAGTNIANMQSVNIGSGAGTSMVVVGGSQGSSGLILQAGTSNILLSGSTTTTYTVGSTLGTGTITIGRSTAANTISIGSGGNNTSNQQSITVGAGAGLTAVSIGATTGASTVTIDAGTGNISIGTSASARTTNIATGAAVQTVTVGSTNSTSALTLNAGSGGVSITANTTLTQGKSINLGQAAQTQTGSLTSGVTINSASGVITTVSASVGTNSSQSFTVTNSTVSANSVVVATLGDYSGTVGTNGHPYVMVDSIASGSFNIRICNASGNNALNGTLKIKFIVT